MIFTVTKVILYYMLNIYEDILFQSFLLFWKILFFEQVLNIDRELVKDQKYLKSEERVFQGIPGWEGHMIKSLPYLLKQTRANDVHDTVSWVTDAIKKS